MSQLPYGISSTGCLGRPWSAVLLGEQKYYVTPYWVRALLATRMFPGSLKMAIPEVSRVAGEAFSMITGIDLANDDLEGEWPAGFAAGPTENSQEDDVAMDLDEDLPWPAPDLIKIWWEKNSNYFQVGTRYLVGKPISVAHCQQVLKTGLQRQRRAAALELAILQADAPLFNTSAPGFRQQQLL